MKTRPALVRLSVRLNLDDVWARILRKKGKQFMDMYIGRVRKLLVRFGSKEPDLDCYLNAVFFDGIAAN